MENNTLSLINGDLIAMDLEVSGKEEAMTILAKMIEAQDRLHDTDKYIEALNAREEIFSTALGYGFAIPHGKTAAVKQATLCFGRLKEEIQWSAEEKATYIFMIAIPEEEAGDTHLKVLSKLSRMIMREEFRDSIKNATSVDEIIALISE